MKPSKQDPRDIMAGMVHTARDNAQPLCHDLPSEAKTAGQRRLKRKHGSPLTFAKACINAIGDISYGEAEAAIRKYAREWDEA